MNRKASDRATRPFLPPLPRNRLDFRERPHCGGEGGVRGPRFSLLPLTPALSPQSSTDRKSRRQWGEGAEGDRLPTFLAHTQVTYFG